MNITPQTLGLITHAHNAALSAVAAAGESKSFLSLLSAAAELTKADRVAFNNAVWFFMNLAKAKNKAADFLPLANKAAARMTRHLAQEALKGSRPVYKRKPSAKT